MSNSLKAALDQISVNKGYILLHSVIHLKSIYKLEDFIDLWPNLNFTVKEAFLTILSSEEVRSISHLLIQLLYKTTSDKEREIFISVACKYSGISTFVEPLCSIHKDCTEDIKLEIEWFLSNTPTAATLRFFQKLREIKQESLYEREMLRLVNSVNRKSKVDGLVKKFHGFYEAIDYASIIAWLHQFGAIEDQELMLTLLENIQFINPSKIATASNYLWNLLSRNVQKTCYVTGLGPVSKSGHHILYEFQPKKFTNQKARILDLVDILRQDNEVLNIVFLDDIIGSGNQAIDFFNNILQQKDGPQRLSDTELARFRSAKKYYLAVVGFEEGIQRIQRAHLFDEVNVHITLSNKDKAFSTDSKIFTDIAEHTRARDLAIFYGNFLYPKKSVNSEAGAGPLGYGGCEALVVFHYNTPNNTLPILWANGNIGSKDWQPLFPRRNRSDSE